MLKFLRNKHYQKRIYIFLAVVVIPPFLMWGVTTSNKESKVPSTVGVIDHKKVSLREYLASYKAVQHQMTFMYGDKLKEVAPSINIQGEAWDRLLLLYHAKKEKIKTTDTEVVEWISNQSIFQSRGRFDPKVYDMVVSRYLRSNARDFEEEIRGLLTIQKVVDRLRSGVVISPEDLKTAYSQDKSSRDLVYGILSAESVKDSIKITDEDIKNIYPIVKDKLTKPEIVDGKTVQRALKPEEAKVELKLILARQKGTELTVAKLNDLKNKMKDADLEKALKELSIEPKHTEKYKKGGDLPGVGVSEAADEVIAKLKDKEVSQAFAITDGAVICKVTKIWEVDNKQFESEKEDFRKKALDQKTMDEMKTLLSKMRQKLKVNAETMQNIFAEGSSPSSSNSSSSSSPTPQD